MSKLKIIELHLEAIENVKRELMAAEGLIEQNEVFSRLLSLESSMVDDVQALINELKQKRIA